MTKVTTVSAENERLPGTPLKFLTQSSCLGHGERQQVVSGNVIDHASKYF